MSQYLLKDGRTIGENAIVDFDATHTNRVGALTAAEFTQFVAQTLPDPPAIVDPGIAVAASFTAGLRRQSLRLKNTGDIQGSVDLLLQAAGIKRL